VEHGKAPASILATDTDPAAGAATPQPLCAYPATARYVGHGSPDDASSFRCTTGKS
jgi:feruloyl esterase